MRFRVPSIKKILGRAFGGQVHDAGYLEVLGDEEAIEFFHGTEERLKNDTATGRTIIQVLEEGYEEAWRFWATLGPNDDLYQTGRTHEAWTDSMSPDAIRANHGGTVRFGSSIEYNQYHSAQLMEPADHMADDIAEAVGDYYVPPTLAFREHMR